MFFQTQAIANSGLSPRIQRLKDRLLAEDPWIDVERACLVTEAHRETGYDAKTLQDARVLEKIVSGISVKIYPDQQIVGMVASKPQAMLLYPEVDIEWLKNEMDTISTRKYDPMYLDKNDAERLKIEVFPYWQGKSMSRKLFCQVPREIRDRMYVNPDDDHSPLMKFIFLDRPLIAMFVPNWNVALKKGFKAIKKEAEERLSALNILDVPHDVSKLQFYEAAIITCNAVIQFAGRYAEAARAQAKKEIAGDKKATWKKIAEICDWVPANPPRNFREAVQSVWFVHCLSQLNVESSAQGMGRIDQYLYPYYQQDIEKGDLTREAALDLIEELWINISSIGHARSEEHASYQAGYAAWHTASLGGITKEGQDATNDLTYICLDAMKHVKTVLPDLVVNVHAQTPQKLLISAGELARAGTGHPKFIHVDNAIHRTMAGTPLSLEEARGVFSVGCANNYTHQHGLRYGGEGFLTFAGAVELALNNGVSRIHGKQVGLKTGDPREFETYEKVWDAFIKQLAYLTDSVCVGMAVAERISREDIVAMLPSIMIPECMQKGIDMSQRTAWQVPQGVLIGITDAADSMAAIKKLVFEDKHVTMSELIDALDCDFEGKEGLRQIFINKAPKYGNDVDYVDKMGQEILTFVCRRFEAKKNMDGWPFTYNSASVSSHVVAGAGLGALPNGRKAGVSLADGISPYRGYDLNGPTAVLKSAATLIQGEPHPALLNMKFTSAELADKDGLERFAAFMRSFVDLKNYHVQFNVVDRETLLDAQQNPEKHRGLLVRVVGYSSYFISLPKDIQDEIIERTDHSLS